MPNTEPDIQAMLNNRKNKPENKGIRAGIECATAAFSSQWFAFNVLQLLNACMENAYTYDDLES